MARSDSQMAPSQTNSLQVLLFTIALASSCLNIVRYKSYAIGSPSCRYRGVPPGFSEESSQRSITAAQQILAAGCQWTGAPVFGAKNGLWP